MKLRSYQQRQHDAALSAWGHAPWHDGESATFRSIILKQPTAGGKTITGSKIIQTIVDQLGGRCLFCADTDELCTQPLEKLQKSTGIIAALEKAESKASLHTSVVVGSAQSMCRPNRLQRFPLNHFSHIFHDEAHEGPDRAAHINARFPAAKICGLTATPFRINLADLSKWYEHVADELDLPELIEGGYIPPVVMHRIPLAIDFKALKMSMTTDGKDVNAEDSDRRIIPWFEAIVAAIMEREPNRFHVAFHGLCATSEKFVEVCNDNGLSARHIAGDSSDRKEILEAFRQKRFHLLSNASLLRKGWDCDIADSLIPLRMTKSVGLVRQHAGRVLRPLDGILNGLDTPEERRAAIAASSKPNAVIFDFLGINEEMGLAGPASIMAFNEEDAKDMQRVMKKHSEADLMTIRAEVQRMREEQLMDKLRLEAAKEARTVTLFDARELLLCDRSLLNYEPAMPWEAKKVTEKQGAILTGIGINPESVECAGLASKMIDAVKGRQKSGMAPVEAFRQLKAAGVEQPQKCSLNDAIRTLGDNFPLTFSRHKGEPLHAIKRSFWNWLWYVAEEPIRAMVREKHPACWRYASKVIFPGREPGRAQDARMTQTR